MSNYSYRNEIMLANRLHHKARELNLREVWTFFKANSRRDIARKWIRRLIKDRASNF